MMPATPPSRISPTPTEPRPRCPRADRCSRRRGGRAPPTGARPPTRIVGSRGSAELAVVGRLRDLQVVVQADRGEAVLDLLPVRVVVDVRTPGADGGEELFEVLDQVRLRLADLTGLVHREHQRRDLLLLR